jgi:hypothetical protein
MSDNGRKVANIATGLVAISAPGHLRSPAPNPLQPADGNDALAASACSRLLPIRANRLAGS